ncbi:hypothetical protein SprV_0301359900 [Sparganum proliferum]
MNRSSNRQTEIYKQDMDNDMVRFAEDTVRAAMNRSTVEQEIASYIRKAFEDRYQPTWSCVAGKSFGSEVAYVKDNFLFFNVDGMSFMIFRAA